MTNKEQIYNVLEHLGYKPQYDDDGDIMMRYQLKHLFFITQDDDEEHFVNITLPQFCSVPEGQELLYFAACNKLTRDTKMAKVFIDQTFKNITATCEFFFDDDETLEKNITRTLRILSIMRTTYNDCIREMSEE